MRAHGVHACACGNAGLRETAYKVQAALTTIWPLSTPHIYMFPTESFVFHHFLSSDLRALMRLWVKDLLRSWLMLHMLCSENYHKAPSQNSTYSCRRFLVL